MCGDNVMVVMESTGNPIGCPLSQETLVYQFDMHTYSQTSTPMSFVFRRDLIDWKWEEDIPLGSGTLFNLRGIEKLGWVPVTGRVLHEYRVRYGSICHCPKSHELADQAYSRSLDRLARDSLGFETSQGLDIVREMLVRKRDLNRCYADSTQYRPETGFQQFLFNTRDTEDEAALLKPGFAT
jgi:hypothetical protein